MSDAVVALATREQPGRAPAEGAETSRAGATLRVDELGLVAVAEGTGPAEVARGAAVMALEQLRSHLARHEDVLDRLRRHPGEALRERLQDLLREGCAQASREVHAFSLRRQATVGVDLDAVVVVGAEAALVHAGRGAVMLAHEGLLHRLTGSDRPSKPLPRSLDEDLADPPTQHPVATTPLGTLSAPPPLECISVGLEPGDRLLLLGPSLLGQVSPRAARQALEAQGAEALLDELLARAAPNPERPRVAAAVQQGPGPAGPDSVQRRMATLRSIELFRWCSEEELHAMVGLARPRTFRQGELLLRQGRVNTTLFLLVEGRVGVNKDGRRIAETDRGSVFGEMSMLDEPRASATVEALTDVAVLTLDRDAFLQALKGDANMAVKVLWSMLLRLSSNLRRTSAQLAERSGPEAPEDPAAPPAANVTPEEQA